MQQQSKSEHSYSYQRQMFWTFPLKLPRLRCMPQYLTDDKSALVLVMACCCQATSHYLSQCWPSSLSWYAISRPQWVQSKNSTHCIILNKPCLVHFSPQCFWKGTPAVLLYINKNNQGHSITHKITHTWYHPAYLVFPQLSSQLTYLSLGDFKHASSISRSCYNDTFK